MARREVNAKLVPSRRFAFSLKVPAWTRASDPQTAVIVMSRVSKIKLKIMIALDINDTPNIEAKS